MGQTKSSSSLLSVPQVSEALGISRALCRGLIKAGTIKSVMVGKRHKVKPCDLETYINGSVFEPPKVYAATRHRRRTA